jgi:hypothetical protein
MGNTAGEIGDLPQAIVVAKKDNANADRKTRPPPDFGKQLRRRLRLTATALFRS